MKFIEIIVLASLSGCNFMPFVMEEAKEIVEFEIEANQHEIERLEKHHNDFKDQEVKPM